MKTLTKMENRKAYKFEASWTDGFALSWLDNDPDSIDLQMLVHAAIDLYTQFCELDNKKAEPPLVQVIH